MLGSFVATAVLSGLLRIAQATGFTRMDIPLMLGTMVTPDRDRAKVAGFLMHMAERLALRLAVRRARFTPGGDPARQSAR